MHHKANGRYGFSFRDNQGHGLSLMILELSLAASAALKTLELPLILAQKRLALLKRMVSKLRKDQCALLKG